MHRPRTHGSRYDVGDENLHYDRRHGTAANTAVEPSDCAVETPEGLPDRTKVSAHV